MVLEGRLGLGDTSYAHRHYGESIPVPLEKQIMHNILAVLQENFTPVLHPSTLTCTKHHTPRQELSYPSRGAGLLCCCCFFSRKKYCSSILVSLHAHILEKDLEIRYAATGREVKAWSETLRLGSTDRQLNIGIWTDGANWFNCSCNAEQDRKCK